MPKISYSNMDRRQLLKRAAALAGGVAMLGSSQRPAGTQSPRKSVRWALLSDTHVSADPENNHRGFYPYQNLQKAVAQMSARLPEGLIITGDLARLEGLPGDYENARKLLAPIARERPICVALGNHDDRDNFLAAFTSPGGEKQAVAGKQVVVIDAAPLRLIVLDSLLYVNKAAGLLGQAQRAWLESYLRTSDARPTILFFHHTPGDRDSELLDAPRLLDIIGPATQVKALVFGHSHVFGFSELDGIQLINLPASGYNFNDDQPLGWMEVLLTDADGEFILHAFGGNTRMDGRTTRLRWRS